MFQVLMISASCNAWWDRNLVEELLKDCLKDIIRSLLAGEVEIESAG